MQQDKKRSKRRAVRVCRSAMMIEQRRSQAFLWLLLTLIVLAVSGVLAARTEGARHLIQNRLRRQTGMNVEVHSTGIGWPYDLKIERLMFTEHTPGARPGDSDARPSLHIEKLRLGWRPRRGAFIKAWNVSVGLYDGEDGRIRPPQLAPLADVEDIEAVTAWFNGIFKDSVHVELEQVFVEQRDADGTSTMIVENLALLSLPLRVPRRAWRYFELTAGRFHDANDRVTTGLRHEWLVSDESALVRLGSRSDVQARVPDEDAAADRIEKNFVKE